MDLSGTTITSTRLTLASFVASDAAEVFAAVRPSLTRYMAFEPSPTPDAFAEIWRTWGPKMAAGTDLFLSIRLRDTGGFTGIAGMHRVGEREPEAGIWIAESRHGNGYGREAVGAVVNWAARELGVAALAYPAAEANRPSRRLAATLGGVVIGTGTLKKPGADLPTLIYRLPAPCPASASE